MTKQLTILLAFFFGSAIASHAQEVITHTSSSGQEIVEVMPEFPGGEEELDKFVEANKQYANEEDKKTGVGTVKITFPIEKDGSVGKPKILKSVSKYYDKEAIRIVKAMPKWKPSTLNGEPVQVQFTFFIKF